MARGADTAGTAIMVRGASTAGTAIMFRGVSTAGTAIMVWGASTAVIASILLFIRIGSCCPAGSESLYAQMVSFPIRHPPMIFPWADKSARKLYPAVHVFSAGGWKLIISRGLPYCFRVGTDESLIIACQIRTRTDKKVKYIEKTKARIRIALVKSCRPSARCQIVYGWRAGKLTGRPPGAKSCTDGEQENSLAVRRPSLPEMKVLQILYYLPRQLDKPS